jgi:hypothetical protein
MLAMSTFPNYSYNTTPFCQQVHRIWENLTKILTRFLVSILPIFLYEVSIFLYESCKNCCHSMMYDICEILFSKFIFVLTKILVRKFFIGKFLQDQYNKFFSKIFLTKIFVRI